jgi:hypothetical protein
MTESRVILKHNATVTCPECGFCTGDTVLYQNHSCDIQAQGNRCEDYPCCGHEPGDCNGLRYGSDEYIKEQVGIHFDCEHEHGFCRLDDRMEDD